MNSKFDLEYFVKLTKCMVMRLVNLLPRLNVLVAQKYN